MTGICAKDILVPLDKYPHIPNFHTLKQAVALMEHSVIEIGDRISLPRSLLVFDKDYRLVGVARRRDILRGLEPEFLQRMPLKNRRELFDVEVDPNLLEMSYEKIAKEIAARGELSVSTVVRPLKTIVDYNDHLARIVHEMVKWQANLLPVERDHRIVGVVRSVDVFHEVSKLVI
jgi:predicted transcriptional regulator